MPIDWRIAGRDERKALYVVTKTIIDRHGISWEQLFRRELSPPILNVSDDYAQQNFAKGTIRRAYAARIHDWITANHLNLAIRLDGALFGPASRSDWQAFLDQHGVYGRLHTRPFSAGDRLGLHEISERHPLSETRIRLGQEFFFELDNMAAGSVVALDRYKDGWYPVPLVADGSFAPVPIQAGCHAFPINAHGAVVPMRQRSHVGEHGHCLLVGPHEVMEGLISCAVAGVPLTMDRLDALAERFIAAEPRDLTAYLENVLFE